MRTLLLLLVATGCTSEVACKGGVKEVGVINELRFARPVDGVSNGFDLDGITSDEDGATGCGIGDYTSPDGEQGVDNALARLIPALELTEAAVLEDLVIEIINSGELLLIWEMDHVDDLHNDECVDFSLYRGLGEPAPDVGTDGFIAPSQTFDIDPAVTPAVAENVSIEDGVVVARGLTMPFSLKFFSGELETTIENAAMRIEMNRDGTFQGYVGGVLDPQAVIDMVNNADVDSALQDALPILLYSNTDIEPDASGNCQKLSLTFELSGVRGYIYED